MIQQLGFWTQKIQANVKLLLCPAPRRVPFARPWTHASKPKLTDSSLAAKRRAEAIYEVDPSSRGREVARGVLHSSPKPEKRSIFGHRRGVDNFCRLFSTPQSQTCLYQTPGRRPPRITARFVNTVTRGWVGPPNERAPFRSHGAVVGFVDRCLLRTRNLAASN